MFKTIDYMDLSGDYVLVDVRSPEEYEEFTIPGAANIPLFDNEQRKEIGTVYNHESIEKATKIGMDYASARLPILFEKISELRKKHDNVILFCERGGMRSSSLCSLFNSVGLKVMKLSGGYKGYRSRVNEALPVLSGSGSYITIRGYTGTGKTELLKELQKRGLDVLDLEKYANHRGSLLGDVGLGKRVSQKQFESYIFDMLRSRKTDNIFVEGESSRIGNIVVPSFIMKGMEGGKHILAEGSLEARVNRIVEEYTGSDSSDDDIIESLKKLEKYISKERIDRYIHMVKQKNYSEVAEELIVKYYDPMYGNELRKYSYDLVVNTDNIESACDEIIKWMNIEAIQ